MLRYLSDYESGEGFRRTIMLAGAAAERAVELEDRLPVAHAALANQRLFTLDLRGADAAFRKALSLPGVGSLELHQAGLFAIRMGRADEGMALLDRAVALDPLNMMTQRGRIAGLMLARRFDEALVALAEAERTMPDDDLLPWLQARTLLGSSRPGEAYEAAARDPVPWGRHTLQAIAAARAGDMPASDRALAELRAIDDGELAFQFAEIHAARGEIDLAFQQLERAVDTSDGGLEELLVSPVFDGMRNDPRYAAIVQRVGFPPA